MSVLKRWFGRILTTAIFSSLSQGLLIWLRDSHEIDLPTIISKALVVIEQGWVTPSAAYWFLVGLAGTIGLIGWLAFEHMFGFGPRSTDASTGDVKSQSSLPIANDAEILRLRTDARRLSEICTGWGTPLFERNDLAVRRERHKNSDHPIWLDKHLAQARRDFVHWVGVAQHDREEHGPTFGSSENRDEILAYLKEAEERIEAGLTGKVIPREYIALSEAARVFYEEVQDTGLGKEARLGGSPDSILNDFGALLVYMNLPVKGVRPPSKKLVSVPNDELSRLNVVNGSKSLSDIDTNDIAYTELKVHRADFRRVLSKALRENEKEESRYAN